MKTLRKRLLSTIFMVTFGVCFAIAQTDTVKHTVDRGETLASIAKRYATTEAKIIELNPDAKQFVYVGMVLTIPVGKTTRTGKEMDESQSNDTVKHDNPNNFIADSKLEETEYSKWKPIINFAYGFLPKPKGDDIKGSNFDFSFNMGANYSVTKSFYVGARIGYSMVDTRTSMHIPNLGYQQISVNNRVISMPLEIGYRLFLKEDDIALVPYAGIDVNCIVKCTMESGVGSHKEKETIDPDKRLGANGRIGLRLNLWILSLGCSYVFSFDENYGENKGFPEISFGAAF